MGVDMVFNPGSTRLPHIYAYIEAAGVKYLPQNFYTSADYFKVLAQFFIG